MQLVINTFGASLRRNGDLYEIHVKERKFPVAAKKVSSILITSGAHFSSDTIQLALENNTEVVMLDKFGHPYGRFWPAKMGSTAAIRRAQINCAESETGLEIVRNWTLTKLKNQKDFLEELGRRRPNQATTFNLAVKRIQNQMDSLAEITGSVEEKRFKILGYEGASAAGYWEITGSLPPANFQFDKRSTHPAVDPFNAMLNYAYGVLYSKVERACIIAGLDPFVGILHTDNYNKKSLVYDMIEPFRIWADRNVTKLFTGRRCAESMFYRSKDGVVLEKEAKDLLLSVFNEYLDESVRYEVKSGEKHQARQIKRLDCIQAEAHTFANRLLGKDGGLPEITETKAIFTEKEQHKC